MSEKCSEDSLTCQIWTKGGTLPKPLEIGQYLQEMTAGYKLRGVEITAVGQCYIEQGKWVFELDKTSEKLALEPIAEKIQAHIKPHKRWKLTNAERAAFKTLKSRWKGKPLRVTLTGVLKQVKTNDSFALAISKIEDKSKLSQPRSQ